MTAIPATERAEDDHLVLTKIHERVLALIPPGGIRKSSLATLMNRDSSNLKIWLQRLESYGFIRILPSKHDARAKIIIHADDANPMEQDDNRHALTLMERLVFEAIRAHPGEVQSSVVRQELGKAKGWFSHVTGNLVSKGRISKRRDPVSPQFVLLRAICEES